MTPPVLLPEPGQTVMVYLTASSLSRGTTSKYIFHFKTIDWTASPAPTIVDWHQMLQRHELGGNLPMHDVLELLASYGALADVFLPERVDGALTNRPPSPTFMPCEEQWQGLEVQLWLPTQALRAFLAAVRLMSEGGRG